MKRRRETIRQFINRIAREVERWPAWMKGKPDPKPSRPNKGQEWKVE